MSQDSDLIIREFKNFIDELRFVRIEIKELNDKLTDVRLEVASLKTSSRIWGAIAGAVPAIIGIVVTYLMGKPKI